MHKILQVSLKQYVNQELRMIKLDLEKADELEIRLQMGSSKKQESSWKKSTSAWLTMHLTVWIITNWRKFLKKWEYQTILPASWEICMKVKKQQLEMDTEQTGYKSGKEYVKAVYCHFACLTYMQNTSCEMPGWMMYKLESRLPGETSTTSDTADDTPLMAESKELKGLLTKVKEESEKIGLKLNIQKTKIMASSPSLHGKEMEK